MAAALVLCRRIALFLSLPPAPRELFSLRQKLDEIDQSPP